MQRTIHQTVCQTLWDYANTKVPEEACGYLVLDPELCEGRMYGTMLPTLNLAADPTKEFWLHPWEFEEHRAFCPGLAIWHSHPYGRWDLSRADRKLMFETQVPMVVVAWQPWPSVTLYVIEAGGIRAEAQYQVEGVTA